MKAFVVGNGTSRQLVNLSDLKPHGKIYGCNALYRDFIPDVLVAVDPSMVQELADSEIMSQTNVWVGNTFGIVGLDKVKQLTPNIGYSAGNTALHIAAKTSTEIYILGFDFVGIKDEINNVYAGTVNYKSRNTPAIFYNRWVRQFKTVIASSPTVQFVRVVSDDFFVDLNANFENYKEINYKEFKDLLAGWQIP